MMIKGTGIFLADGSVRRVEDIKIGDRVMTKEGGGSAAINIWRGMEETACRVVLADGMELTCIEQDILLTASGPKRVSHLTESDQILRRSGWDQSESVPIRQITRAPGQYDVYDLSTNKEEDWLITEGCYVGTMETGNQYPW